jgi:dTMP kinase
MDGVAILRREILEAEEEFKMNKRGLFIVFEGVDGAGTTTQVPHLVAHIKRKDKYNDVLETREPTWRAQEIRAKLEKDKDAFSDGLRMAELYVEDRKEHTKKVILPNLREGIHVLSDRYSLSTCAYQWAQGVNIDKLVKMHKHRHVIVPDLTLFVDIDANVALERVELRGEKKEKFEQREFLETLVGAYRNLFDRISNDKIYGAVFGQVVKVDGERKIRAVAEKIANHYDVAESFAGVSAVLNSIA